MNRIPSWLVGVLGAAAVLAATAVSLVVIAPLDAALEKYGEDIDAQKASMDRMWNSHLLADEREARAELFLAEHLSAPSEFREFYLSRAGASFRGAVLAMIAASDQGEERTNELQGVVAQLEPTLLSDVATAYGEFKTLIDELRRQSGDSINAASKSVKELQQDRRETESRRDRLRSIFTGLSLLGLAIVLLKDLPVWKQNRLPAGDPFFNSGSA